MGGSPTTSSRSRPIIEAGTAAIMPYYGMPVGLEVDGETIEEVGFGYNRQVVTGLLREQLGYDGVVVTDWELVNDNHVGDQVLPARAWGVEHLDPHGRMELILHAGADQFGGEECVDILLDLVAQGRVTEARVDESARRLLAVKFRLGLFDDPFVDEDAAAATVGREDFRDEGYAAQARSVTVLHERLRGRAAVLPLRQGLRIYAENVSPEAVGRATACPVEPAGGRRRRAGAADGAVRAALGPVPRVVVPPGVARLPARVSSPGSRGSPRSARSSSTSCSTGRPCVTPLLRFAGAVVGSYGSSDDALLDALTGTHRRRGGGCRSTCRGRWSRCAQHGEDVPGLRRPAVRLRPRACVSDPEPPTRRAPATSLMSPGPGAVPRPPHASRSTPGRATARACTRVAHRRATGAQSASSSGWRARTSWTTPGRRRRRRRAAPTPHASSPRPGSQSPPGGTAPPRRRAPTRNTWLAYRGCWPAGSRRGAGG